MINHHTNPVFIDNLEVSDRIVSERKTAFLYQVDSLNANVCSCPANPSRRQMFDEQASRYEHRARRFRPPIGQNQGIQFPIAKAHMNDQAAERSAIAPRSC